MKISAKHFGLTVVP